MPKLPANSQIVIVKERAPQPHSFRVSVAESTAALSRLVSEVLSGLPYERIAPLFARDVPDEEIVRTSEFEASDPTPGQPDDRRQYLRVEASSSADAEAVRVRLKSDGRFIAYIESEYDIPSFTDADFGIGPAPETDRTADFSARQIYLDDAPRGLGVRFAWQQIPTGAAGANVTGGDVESGWILDHEDFGAKNRVQLRFGVMRDEIRFVQHGTAVVGTAIALNDSHGVMGIAPDVPQVLCFAVAETDAANAIDQATRELEDGDVLVIELQARPPKFGGNAIPVEYNQQNYDAVKRATAKGIIVVAAAGNSGLNLDDPMFDGAFDRATHDSGAIIVGAGTSPDKLAPDRSRIGLSNWGSRVDVQGYGGSVCTTGGGDMQGPVDGDQRRWYTNTFDGTSSATAMVWGACLLLQSIAKRAGRPLGPREMRELLSATGSEQTAGPGRPTTEHIGPRPDLRTALIHRGLAS
jgi:subtilisin family serine protease